MTELWRLPASALAEGFRSGSFTPLDALESCLAQSARCQPAINAFVCMDADGARAAATASGGRWSRGEPLGPLDGIPVSLKDNFHARGLPTTWGSKLLRGWVAPADELPVARLRAAGAVLFGKTNLPEFALQGITDNLVTGLTRNPWDLALTPGGSSGGGAAAVASGCGPLALVTDGGGSTRRPASHTGLVGFKPSAGRVQRRGGLPQIFLDYEVPGMLGRNVADVRELARVLFERKEDADAPGIARPSRILFVPRFADHPVDPDIARCTAEAARQFSSLGHRIEEVPTVDWAEEVNASWPALSCAGLAWMMEDASRFPESGLPAGAQPDIALCSPAAQASLQQGRDARGTAVFAALAAIRAVEKRMAQVFAAHDFILTPATAALPWPAAQSHPPQIAGRNAGPRGHAVFTAFANAAGLPAIALPGGFAGGFARGLQMGFQLVGRRGADMSLLALALQHEEAFPRPLAWPAAAAATMPA